MTLLLILRKNKNVRNSVVIEFDELKKGKVFLRFLDFGKFFLQR